MRVEIKVDIFHGNEFQKLNYLIGIAFYEYRYELFVDLAVVQDSNLYKRLDKEDQAILEQDFNKFIQESTSPNIVISNNDPTHFNIDEAIRYLTQPFSIILENSSSDSYFIKALIKHFDKTNEIGRHLKNGWCQFENAGGATNVINFLSEKLRQFRSLPKDNYLYLRAFVVFDSDKEFPEMPLNQSKQNLTKFLRDNKIGYHCLEKRESENYLPDEAFEEIDDNREFIESYLRLKPLQKDHFDLENGFPQKNFKHLQQEIQDLFNDVSDEDKAIFRKDDLKRINNSGKNNFKTDFPRLFLSNKVTGQNLVKRCSHHSNDPKELPNLISKISKLL